MNSPSDEELATLADLPILILTNIEDVAGWADKAPLVTAHCHASVLNQDLPALLHRLREAEAERDEARRVLAREQLFRRADEDPVAYAASVQAARVETDLVLAAEARAERAEALLREAEARNSSYESSHGSASEP